MESIGPGKFMSEECIVGSQTTSDQRQVPTPVLCTPGALTVLSAAA